MTPFLITSIYAAVLALMMTALSSHVSMKRGSTNTSILDGGHPDLALRIRRHGNFIENVPFSLLLMLLAELDGAGHNWIHGAGVLIIVGRIMHAIGLRADTATPVRLVGGIANSIANLLMIGNILYLAFVH
jgi:uncharacterized protein